ncbi:F-box and WD repeat domain containing 8 L homeolog [Xenopus laevis]|uniref:F-box/WD repeat-containing protein 8 n=1 Tax=Xenopus laevis TaxID=8355 RepID=Q6GPF2_XENLA|nr:F-box and WD repeat domain containing 8 L homeolog [Xenopus laevis]AAH73187.1 MGC80422 protein [Xenopus laevis]
MALDASLEEFRSSWINEIHGAPTAAGRSDIRKRRRSEELPEPEKEHEEETAWRYLPGSPARNNEEDLANQYVELAEKLLGDKHRTIESAERTGPAQAERTGSLVDQLIDDLNEINEIPFFDIQLPYEIALQIFKYLDRKDLGRCAQVSKSWRVLAEDELLWYDIGRSEGYLTESNLTAGTSWKEALKQRRTNESMLRANWKNRTGAVSQLHYELGKVLCDVHTCNGVVIAGYTSGDVRLWDTRVSCFDAPYLKASRDSFDVAQPPSVSFVKINRSLAVAVYEDGTVDVWSLQAGQEPIHHYQHNQKIQALALCPESAAIATASGFQIKVECPDERGYWRSTCHFRTQKLVNFLHLIHGSGGHSLAVAAADEMVYLLKAKEPEHVLHSTYGQPVTCLDVSPTHAAFGVKSFGWFSNHGNKIHVYNLQTGQCLTTLGNSTGDFTCISLKDSPPNLLVTGNRDRRVRVYDMRCSTSLCSVYGHQLGVSAVQMDDWKIVSGGVEGLTCVWDQRMATKLWEMHTRHPVRYIWFNSHSLITANIPDDKSPRGASIMDDDLTAHRRHRGTINVYEFLLDQKPTENILPICTSSYNEVTGYNYNVGLAVPYDLV